MKTRNDCEIACDCVKRANVVLHVGLCKEIFARKHTATHKPTYAQPLYSYQRGIHTSNKMAGRRGAPRPPMTVSRQECERQQCEANSANANSAKGSTVRMPTVRMRQRCECQQCECDSSAKDDSPNCAKPCPQLRQLDLDFRQAFFVLLYPSFTHKRSTIGARNSA